MKVICTRLPTPTPGMELESSPWVSVHNEYTVLSLLAEPGGRVQLHLLLDDGRSLGWFDSVNFLTVEGGLPSNWDARLDDGGTLELAPSAWLAPGFWEAYYDRDPSATDVVAAELQTILGEGSP